MSGRYLPTESFDLIGSLFKTYPLYSVLGCVALFGIVLLILKKVFGRIAFDMVVFAILVVIGLAFSGSAVYLLTHVKGYRFG